MLEGIWPIHPLKAVVAPGRTNVVPDCAFFSIFLCYYSSWKSTLWGPDVFVVVLALVNLSFYVLEFRDFKCQHCLAVATKKPVLLGGCDQKDGDRPSFSTFSWAKWRLTADPAVSSTKLAHYLFIFKSTEESVFTNSAYPMAFRLGKVRLSLKLVDKAEEAFVESVLANRSFWPSWQELAHLISSPDKVSCF